MEERERWTHLIKDTRAAHGVGIFEAEKIALNDLVWRRWVEKQINSDARCRKMALYHLRTHGSEALIEQHGEMLAVRSTIDSSTHSA